MTRNRESTLREPTTNGAIASFLDAPLSERERRVEEELRSRINVARLIGEYRVRCGLTQDELARRAGTKQSRVSEIENLRGNVRFDTLDRIAGALGLTVTLEPRDGMEFHAASGPRSTQIRVDDQIDFFHATMPSDYGRAFA